MENSKTIREIYQSSAHQARNIDNYRDLVYSCGQLYGKRTAFKIKNKEDGKIHSISYSKLLWDYKCLCTALIERGLSGKKIAIMGRNSYYWALTYLCAATVGVAVPLDSELHKNDVLNFLHHGECSILFADKKSLAKLTRDGEVGIECVCTDEAEGDASYIDDVMLHGGLLYQQGMTTVDSMEIDQNAMSVLIFTSGTTGSSKGVCLSMKNICSNITSAAKGICLNESDVVLSVLPLHHTFECTIGFLFVIYSGACITYCDGLMSILKNLKEYHPTGLVVVPAMLEFFVRRIKASVVDNCPRKYKKTIEENSLSKGMSLIPKLVSLAIKKLIMSFLGGRLRLVYVGAAAIHPSVIEDFSSIGVEVYQGYGLTECSPLVAFNNPFCNNVESAGFPTLDVEVVIDNPGEDGVGEILVKGENVMLGYYNDPEATALCMKDGYFKTGDLGCLDSDGFLYIKGRCKNVIVTKNGKNIFPEELESKLLDHPEIAEVIVFGEETEDLDYVIKAKVFPNKEYIKKTYPEGDDGNTVKAVISGIIDGYNRSVPSYKQIKRVEILSNELEKTTTRKIKRFGENVS